MSKHHSIRNLAARLRRDQSGTAAVELGLVAIMLAGIITPLVDLGMGTYTKMRVQSAAEAGAQYALVHGYDATTITSVAQNATKLGSNVSVTVPALACYCITNNAIAKPAVSCASTCANGDSPGSFVEVDTQYTYTPVLAPTSPMTLKGSSFARLQ
jgi:Flp pilus assembly protein TadG